MGAADAESEAAEKDEDGKEVKRCAAKLGLLIAAAVAAVAAETKPKATIADLAWLAGTWRLERNGRIVTEHWRPLAGGLMLGTSHTVANQKTVEYEFIVLRADALGDLVYIAKPSGQPSIPYVCAASSTAQECG